MPMPTKCAMRQPTAGACQARACNYPFCKTGAPAPEPKQSATMRLIELAEHLSPSGEIGDGLVNQFHEAAALARLEQVSGPERLARRMGATFVPRPGCSPTNYDPPI